MLGVAEQLYLAVHCKKQDVRGNSPQYIVLVISNFLLNSQILSDDLMFNDMSVGRQFTVFHAEGLLLLIDE
jgi:hypothetical protein